MMLQKMPLESKYSPLVRLLLQAGHRAPSADNSQPWRFHCHDSVVTILYDDHRARGKTFGPDEHATLLTMGAVTENLLQMANWLNVDARLVTLTENFYQINYASIEIDHLKALQPKPEPHPLFKRHTNRLPYTRSPLARNVINLLQTMAQGNCSILIITDPKSIHSIARWVRIASEARFQTKELHEFLGQSLRFTKEAANHGDGLDVRTLNLPVGGAALLYLLNHWPTFAFLNKFKLYRFLANIEAQSILDCSAVVAIIGSSATKHDVLAAGGLMERAWIYLNSQGIAVQPYYVVTDQLERLKSGRISDYLLNHVQKLRSEVDEYFASEETAVHMLFRIGYPRTDPPRSMRLPLEMVTECT